MNLFNFENILVPQYSADKVNSTAKYALELGEKLEVKITFLKVITFETLENLKEDMQLSSTTDIEQIILKNDALYLDKLSVAGYEKKNVLVLTKFAYSVEEGIRSFLKENKASLTILERHIIHRNKHLTDAILNLKAPYLIQKNDFPVPLENIRIMIPCDNRKSHLSCICQASSIAWDTKGSLLFYYSNTETKNIGRNNCPVDVISNIEKGEQFARENGIPYETIIRHENYVDGIIRESIEKSVHLIIMGGNIQNQFSGSINLDSVEMSFENLREGIFDINSAKQAELQSECNFMFSFCNDKCLNCDDCKR